MVDSVHGMEELFDLEYEDDMDVLRDLEDDAGRQPNSRKSQSNLVPDRSRTADQGHSVYGMEELFDLEYEDDMDVLRDLEGDAGLQPDSRKSQSNLLPDISRTADQDEQQYLNSLEVSRVVPKSKKMLNFGGEEQNCSSSGPALADVEKNVSVDADVDAVTKGNNHALSKKRGPDDDFCVAADAHELLHTVKKFKQQNSQRWTDDLGLKDSVEIEDRVSSADCDHAVPGSSVGQELSQMPSLKPSRVSRRIPEGNFMAVTGSDGSRAYLSMTSEDELKKKVARLSFSKNTFHLLTIPLDVLKAQAEEERQLKELQKSNRQPTDEQEILAEEADVEREFDAVEAVNHDNDNLWVDRYAPRKYTELLSDEIINRGLLRWLKLWDCVVFGKENKTRNSILNPKPHKDKTDVSSKKSFNPSETVDELDQLKRPLFKLALVSGPPGLGKTTLAHIIARHAGYNVVEMNASDDRSPEAFKEKIESATQMKAVLGADPRPNCLIIDEIDGAPQPAINVLLSVIKKTDHTNAKKKKGEPDLLRRPIICICNDLYVPALRQLRQNAFLVTFYGASSARLASRLLEISRLERLKTDLTTLFALCEKAENDIRSCINTLQFVKAQGSQLSLRDIQTMSLGQKDAHKTLFSVWNHVFSLPKPSRKRYVNPYDREVTSVQQAEELAAVMTVNNSSMSSRFHNTLQIALAAGEDNKIQNGLFENYLEAKVKDPHLSLVKRATNWLCFIDVVNQITNESQNYSLMKFLPFLPVMFHMLFASNSPHKIVYPHSQFEFQTKLSKSENLIGTMLADVMPSIRSNLSHGVIVLELLPLLCDVIQPTLRPVNTQLYSTREREELAQLIRVMTAYNLNYQQERAVDGQYTYRLEPNVEDLVRFPDIKPRRQLNYATRQLIAREIELEKLRRSEGMKSEQKKTPSVVKQSKSSTEAVNDKKLVPNHHRQKLEPKRVAFHETKPTLDFFGRKIQLPTAEPNKAGDTGDVVGGDVWFRFKEGFSNAVRKTVRIQDLI